MLRKKIVRILSVSCFAFLVALPILSYAAPSFSETENHEKLGNKKILFVLTSHGMLGDSKEKTGYWLEELAAPYEILSKEGAKITLASPLGGKPPVDPVSLKSAYRTKYTKIFDRDSQAQEALSHTLPLADVQAGDYDAVFYPGGHGPLYDLAGNPASIHLIETFSQAKKPLAFVCHSPSVLKNVKDSRGEPLVKGRKITGFSNSEEAGAALSRKYHWVPSFLLMMGNAHTYTLAKLPEDAFMTKLHLKGVIPFLTESMLKESGADYQRDKNWASFAVQDVTSDGAVLLSGQNPQSSALVGRKMVEILSASTR